MSNLKEMKLLYEYSEPEVQIEESLNENKEPQKKYKIKGSFSTIGERNRNGRIYPREIWENEVRKYQDVIKSGSINRLCEWKHPERSTVDPMESVAVIDKLWIEGKYVMGEATLLDNPKANQLKTLIDNGIKISVSSRGVGSIKDGVVDNFKLITYDIVDTPSDFNATMEGYCVTESEKSFYITEDGKIVEAQNTQISQDKEISEEKEIKENSNKINETFKENTKTIVSILDEIFKGE